MKKYVDKILNQKVKDYFFSAAAGLGATAAFFFILPPIGMLMFLAGGVALSGATIAACVFAAGLSIGGACLYKTARKHTVEPKFLTTVAAVVAGALLFNNSFRSVAENDPALRVPQKTTLTKAFKNASKTPSIKNIENQLAATFKPAPKM